MSFPLPIIPLKAAIRRVLGLCQQLPQATEVVLIPSLLGQVHIRHVEQVVGFGFLRVRLEARPLLRLLRRLSFVAFGLGGEPLLLFGVPGPAGLKCLPSADRTPIASTMRTSAAAAAKPSLCRRTVF